jgi:ABC-type uncharacterized transport system involved in gliding motility auxiliary subunit
MKFGSKATAIALLFVGLVLINYLASSLPLRIDATAEAIYTLSPGTRSLLSKLDEPVTLELYFSKSINGLPVFYKNYASRVQEMLRQYVRASHGKLQLTVIDPRPDTPEEEKATAAGLTSQPLSNGDRLTFGLVASQTDRQKSIATFAPQREPFLEYDLSQLIANVQSSDKKKLGLISSIPLQAAPQVPMMRMRQPQQQSQFIISEWENSFEIVPVESSAAELPANLDALAVIHPQNLSPKLQFAIDQFLLAGKPVFIAVDPSSQFFKRQSDQMAMFNGPQPNVSSNLPELFKAYGIAYNPDNVVGDLTNAATVASDNGGGVRYPVWLALDKAGFNAKALPTAQLNSLVFIESGSFTVKPEPGITVTPLVETSAQTGELPAMLLAMSQPEELSRQIKPTGKKTIAALIQGKLKSAFPSGAPADTPPADSNAKDEKPDTKNAEKKTATDSLKESKGTSTLVLVADTDWLLDDYSVRRFNFLGSQAAEPLNDNLAFASNTVEFLAGSQDLISIRGKSGSQRPFTVVRAMEGEAQKKYQEKLDALDARLKEVQDKLTTLQGKKTEGNRLVASPEVAKAIEDFQKQDAAMRGERRAIRRALREGIDSLENGLLALNLLASPLLVGIFGLWFYRHRRK